MDSGNLSASDVALLNRDNNMDGSNSWIWIIAILILIGGFGGYGGRNDNPAMIGPGIATQADMTAGLNNQTVQAQLQNIAIETANNNLEVVKAVNSQTTDLLQQNNTNLINAIQGFNQVNQNIAAQGAQISQAVQQLGYQMEQCCCSIKTQMLQDRLDDARAANVAKDGIISNLTQNETLLNTMGRYVAWAGNGTQGTTVTTG